LVEKNVMFCFFKDFKDFKVVKVIREKKEKGRGVSSFEKVLEYP